MDYCSYYLTSIINACESNKIPHPNRDEMNWSEQSPSGEYRDCWGISNTAHCPTVAASLRTSLYLQYSDSHSHQYLQHFVIFLQRYYIALSLHFCSSKGDLT